MEGMKESICARMFQTGGSITSFFLGAPRIITKMRAL